MSADRHLGEEPLPGQRHASGLATLTSRLGDLVPLKPDSINQRLADNGLILRVLVGSGVHGTAVDGQDDIDEMGICLEPPGTVIGSRKFEHYIYRTQPEGVRSGPGDLDLTIYSLRKYVRLAAAGNPTVLLPLFVPDGPSENTRYINDYGRQLLSHTNAIISRKAANRFLGYIDSQRRALLGERAGGNGAGRQDIIERYGFDSKFAMHMVRLGIQGVELLTTGRITLPIPEPHLTWLRELRQGQRTMREAIDASLDLDDQLLRLRDTSPLHPEPDRDRLDHWLIDVHREFWGWSQE